MPSHYPLIACRLALDDALQALEEINATLHALRDATGGDYPPGSLACLTRLLKVRLALEQLFPEALREAIAQEQAEYDRQEARFDETRLPTY